MIDIDRLRFPSPTGVAHILRSPGGGPLKSLVLGGGMLIGALIYLPAALPSLTSAAEVSELDDLVERGRVTAARAELTKTIDGWIAAGAAPAEVVGRGELVKELLAARQARSASPGAEAGARVNAATSALTAHRAANPGAIGSDALSQAAAAAARGETPWASLRDVETDWARSPLWGYADLGIRLEAEPNGATRRTDRDGDARPDLLVTDNAIDVGRSVGLPDSMQLVFAIAPFAIGAGFITGRAGLVVLAGGILAYLFLSPVVFRMGWMPPTTLPDQAAAYASAVFNRPLGIGLLLGGALMGVLASAPAIREALRALLHARRSTSRDELGLGMLVPSVLIGGAVLFGGTWFIGERPVNAQCLVTQESVSEAVEPVRHAGYVFALSSDEARATWEGWDEARRDDAVRASGHRPGLLAGLAPWLRAAIVALVGVAWIWFAGIIIAQCTGMTDWSPISGMALITVILILLLAGTSAVMTGVLIGAALCVAITLASDMMGDLKTGYLVGAMPRRQQLGELLVVPIGPVICMLTLLLIVAANQKDFGIAIGPGTPTVAPQAQALQAVINGVQGGQMPYALYGFGALLGALLGLGSFAGLGVLVGLSMYLPFNNIATYGVGCILNIVIGRIWGRSFVQDWGIPFAAGLIVGESIIQLVVNMLVLAG